MCLKILSSLPGGENPIFHNFKFSILDADEQNLLSNFSNILMESGKLAWNGSSQEELLETAYKASLKRIPLLASAGLAQLLPLAWTAPPAAISSGMPTPRKEHLVCPYGAGQQVHLLDIL